MTTFTWRDGEVPANLKIKQVYGIIFSSDGRIMLKVERDNAPFIYSFGGGKPEIFDKDMQATLEREMLEELNTTIKKPVLVGYQEVDEQNGKPLYAQVRMTALIDKIGKRQPDPDNGKTYERLLTNPNNAIKLLGWGECGEKQILSAVKIAKEKFGIKEFLDKDELFND